MSGPTLHLGARASYPCSSTPSIAMIYLVRHRETELNVAGRHTAQLIAETMGLIEPSSTRI